MLVQEMYYSVFFSKNKEIGHKRIDRNKFINLTDGIIDKFVELDGIVYQVCNIKTFHIVNSIDNTLYAICDVIKNK